VVGFTFTARIFQVQAHWTYPDGIETHALDIVKFARNSSMSPSAVPVQRLYQNEYKL
jgi:hypothetical protein